MATAETILGLSTEGIKCKELVTQMMEMLRSHTGKAIQRFMIAGSSYYPLGWKAKGRKWCYWNLEDGSIWHVRAWREGPWSHRRVTAAAREATGSRARGEEMPWLLPSFCPRIFCEGLSLAKPPTGQTSLEAWEQESPRTVMPCNTRQVGSVGMEQTGIWPVQGKGFPEPCCHGETRWQRPFQTSWSRVQSQQQVTGFSCLSWTS